MSFCKHMRVAHSSKDSLVRGPLELPHVETAQLLMDLKNTILVTRIICIKQGLALFAVVSQEMNWNVDLSDVNVARCLHGGCLLASPVLNLCLSSFTPAVAPTPAEATYGAIMKSIMPLSIVNELGHRQNSWRRIATLVSAVGVACPVITSSLAFYDAIRRRRIASLSLLSLTANYLEAADLEIEVEVEVDAEGIDIPDDQPSPIESFKPRWTNLQKESHKTFGLG